MCDVELVDGSCGCVALVFWCLCGQLSVDLRVYFARDSDIEYINIILYLH